jgi:VanZ family protein
MFLKYNRFAFLWAIVVLILTLVTGVKNANLEFSITDKLVHIAMFTILSFMLIVGFSKQSDNNYLKFNAEKSSVLICVFFGLFVELIQYFTPCRSFSWHDVIANAIGAFFGWGAFYMVYKFKEV